MVLAAGAPVPVLVYGSGSGRRLPCQLSPRLTDQASAVLGSCVRWVSCSSPFWHAASLRPQPPGSSATEMTEMAETTRR